MVENGTKEGGEGYYGPDRIEEELSSSTYTRKEGCEM